MCWLSRVLKKGAEEKPAIGSIRGVPWATIKAELDELGLELINKENFQPDRYTYHPAKASKWAELVPWLTFPAEGYVNAPESPDCDEYAKRASVEASFQFHLTCFECWGYRPDPETGEPVRHAFSLVRRRPGDYRVFEPNAGFIEAGELFKFGEYGYKPDCWRL